MFDHNDYKDEVLISMDHNVFLQASQVGECFIALHAGLRLSTLCGSNYDSSGCQIEKMFYYNPCRKKVSPLYGS